MHSVLLLRANKCQRRHVSMSIPAHSVNKLKEGNTDPTVANVASGHRQKMLGLSRCAKGNGNNVRV